MDALEALVDGIEHRTIDYGVLAIASDGSKTIGEPLTADLIRIGQGVVDELSDIGRLGWTAWRLRVVPEPTASTSGYRR